MRYTSICLVAIALLGCPTRARQHTDDGADSGRDHGGVATGGGGSSGSGGTAGPDASTGGMGGEAVRCGDNVTNGTEVCDSGGSGALTLGSCNPECTGFYEKKFIRETRGSYSGNLGGPSGADQKCQAEYGSLWKALIVGGGRTASVTPLKGDGQIDWVVKKYTYYYNENNESLWRTDDVALLGVRDGQRMNLYTDAFFRLDIYPWGGYDSTWVEVSTGGTCLGWTATTGEDGTFPLPDLTTGATQPCPRLAPLLCVQQ